jgi:hypothetical protein
MSVYTVYFVPMHSWQESYPHRRRLRECSQYTDPLRARRSGIRFKADPGSHAVYGVGLSRLACWDCRFESRRRHGCLCCVLNSKVEGVRQNKDKETSTEKVQRQNKRRNSEKEMYVGAEIFRTSPGRHWSTPIFPYHEYQVHSRG